VLSPSNHHHRHYHYHHYHHYHHHHQHRRSHHPALHRSHRKEQYIKNDVFNCKQLVITHAGSGNQIAWVLELSFEYQTCGQTQVELLSVIT
jgi:hypothetical protein